MKHIILGVLGIAFFTTSCKVDSSEAGVHRLDVSKNTTTKGMIRVNHDFNTYLPVYSSLYTITEREKMSLTSTVSIHNINLQGTLFVKQIMGLQHATLQFLQSKMITFWSKL